MGLEQDIRRAGELLIEVKDRLKWGEFMPWLTEHGIPDRTARHYMRLARESATVADFPTVREAVAALTTATIEKPTVRVPVSVTRNGPHVERHVIVTADGEVIELWRSARNRPRPHPSSAWWTVPWVTECPRCHCDLYANHPSGTDE